jgi:CRP/FNR family transcriptional regulator, cyclic AMP receptor protein
MRALEDLIAASPLFAGLDQGQLALIAGCGVNERVPAGAELLREGGPADRFFLIRSGAVALQVQAPGRGAVVIETLHAGEVVGWSWLFAPYRWHLDGRAIEPTALIAFDGRCLREKCEADHDLGYRLMSRFAAAAIERLQATRLQLLDVYANPVAG